MGFVDSLTDDYLGGFSILENRIWNVFRECLASVGCSTIDSRYALLNQSIILLKTFNDAPLKIKMLEDNLSQVENVIQSFTLNASKTKDTFEPIKKEGEEILRYFKTALASINNEVEQIFKQIEESPFGKKEHGAIFENLILSFFDVVFIHELIREKPPSLKYKGVKLDGFYKIFERFDARERTGFEFENLLIECKNKTPQIDDLMQCFKYTLFFQTSEISKVPLTLLVCRHLPGMNSSIWEIIWKIFDKQIQNETRLILMLEMNDLREMKHIKVNGGDAAKIIRDKINAFS